MMTFNKCAMRSIHKLIRVFFFLTLFAALPSLLEAQKTELRNAFVLSIRGEHTVLPDQTLKFKNIEAKRKQVWEAWRAANHLIQEDELPKIDTLNAQHVNIWALPDSLEPAARLNYYFGRKGDAEQYPLFLYLHGSGPRDQEFQTGLLLAKRFADAPSVYFIPQIPQEGKWYRWWQRSKQWAFEKLLRQWLLSASADPNRLYVFGISEGGYGSQRLASFYADYWAAAGPMAGGEPLKNAPIENLRNTPFSLLTGALDEGFYRNKLTAYTKAALEQTKFVYRVELLPGYGHHIDYSLTTPWLAQYKRNPTPLHVSWEDFEMDGRYRRGFSNLVVLERPDTQGRTYYDETISNNTIDLSVNNVVYTTIEKDTIWGIDLKFQKHFIPATSGKIRIYLSENQIDLKRPVRILVNGQEKFNGRLRPSLKAMAESLSVFYDPERIFPVYVDITI